jgi:hypothetical protein
MKNKLLSSIVLVAICSFFAEGVIALTVDEVVTLVKLEIPERTIMKKIKKDGSSYKLSPSQILKLKKSGVSDKLIRFMLQSGASGSKAGTLTKAKKDKPKRALSAAEMAAEEARLKEEALRLAAEQRRREDVQRKAFAGKVLRKGQALANNGKWVEAVAVFTKFVNDGVGGVPFAPDSDEAYVATYGIANALARAGLSQGAANKLLEVVRAGPDKLFFDKAFIQLRELRRKINYRPPELEDLTRFSVDSKSKEFRNSFYYFVGEFLYDFGLLGQFEEDSGDEGQVTAIAYLARVAQDAPDYPRAQYLLGLIAFQDESLNTGMRVKRASQSFQKAVVSGYAFKNQGMVDLAFLALARLAYEYQQYDAAIYYYRKISANSTKLVRAFYESGWSYFLKNDISRALGTFHALHSPYFSHHFYPELWILEATVYVNLCHRKQAEEAIKRFEEDVLVMGPPLRDFLKRHRRPEDFYQGIISSINTPRSATIPRQLASPVLENVEFYNLYKTIRQIRSEESKVKGQLGRLGAFGQELLAKLGRLRSERIAEAGVIVQRTLRDVQKDIARYQDKLTELRIDLQEIIIQESDDQIAQIEKGSKKVESKAVERQGTIAIAGSDSMVWPFEGEFWKDEIRAYRSFLVNKCKD